MNPKEIEWGRSSGYLTEERRGGWIKAALPTSMHLSPGLGEGGGEERKQVVTFGIHSDLSNLQD